MTNARPALEMLAGREVPAIENDILELSPVATAHYDRIGRFYDPLIRTNLYNRLAWASSPRAYRAFAERVFRSRNVGPHIELGCGSLAFTADLYREDRGRPIILIDQSLVMLRIARARLKDARGYLPAHVALVRGDARDLRITTGVGTTVLAMLVLHVLDDGPAFLSALNALADAREATIGVASIFRGGSRRGDVFLRLLHATRELAEGRSLPEIQQMMSDAMHGWSHVETNGSMSFLTVDRS
jgi:SAM-dependent methyltransferase